MSGNATARYSETAILSVCAVDAPLVVTSAEFDERLAATYQRVGLRPGLLQRSGRHPRAPLVAAGRHVRRRRARWPAPRRSPRPASTRPTSAC